MYDKRTEKNLQGLHPDLLKVIELAWKLSKGRFMVIEGKRTIKRQEELYKAGATRTMNSRHLTGHAFDFVPLLDGKVRWDWPLFHREIKHFKDAAIQLGVHIVWGGDWKTFKDGPHIELSWKHYPGDKK